jgi:hypothetical protein
MEERAWIWVVLVSGATSKVPEAIYTPGICTEFVSKFEK